MQKSLDLRRFVASAMTAALLFLAAEAVFAGPRALVGILRSASSVSGAGSMSWAQSTARISQVPVAGGVATQLFTVNGAVGSGSLMDSDSIAELVATLRPLGQAPVADGVATHLFTLEGPAGSGNFSAAELDEILMAARAKGIVFPFGFSIDETMTVETLALMCLGNRPATRVVQSHVFRQSRYHTANASERDDLTQDTLVKLLQACSRFLEKRSFFERPKAIPGYVAQTTKNVWIDSYRRSSKSTSAGFETESLSEEEVARLADPGPGPAELAEMKQILRAVTEANLSKREEEVILLVAAGNSRKEIAEQLGISQERVKELVGKARMKLEAASWRSRSAGSVIARIGGAELIR